MEEALAKTIKWIENNSSAEKDEFNNEKKKIEGICDPIMAKIHLPGGADTEQMPPKNPPVEDVD